MTPPYSLLLQRCLFIFLLQNKLSGRDQTLFELASLFLQFPFQCVWPNTYLIDRVNPREGRLNEGAQGWHFSHGACSPTFRTIQIHSHLFDVSLPKEKLCYSGMKSEGVSVYYILQIPIPSALECSAHL